MDSSFLEDPHPISPHLRPTSHATASATAAAASSRSIISPYNLYLHPKLVVKHYQFWRLVTNFLYFRKMGNLFNHELPSKSIENDMSLLLELHFLEPSGFLIVPRRGFEGKRDSRDFTVELNLSVVSKPQEAISILGKSQGQLQSPFTFPNNIREHPLWKWHFDYGGIFAMFDQIDIAIVDMDIEDGDAAGTLSGSEERSQITVPLRDFSPDGQPDARPEDIVERLERKVYTQSDGVKSYHQSFLPAGTTLASDNHHRLIYSYQHAISSFAARLIEEEVEAMKEKDGFVSARPERMLRLQTTHTPHFLGLHQELGFWKETNFGDGVIIGVLDTGVLPSHPSFSDEKHLHQLNGEGSMNSIRHDQESFNLLTILPQKHDSALLTQIRRRIASLMIEKRESDRGSVVFSSSRSVCPSLFSRSRSHDSSPLSLDLVSSSSRSIDRSPPPLHSLSRLCSMLLWEDGVDVISISIIDYSQPLFEDNICEAHLQRFHELEQYTRLLCAERSLNGTDVNGKVVLYGFSTTADAHVLPATHVSHQARLKIKAYINSTNTPVAAILFEGTVIGDSSALVVASFSSRGPNLASPRILKPDIIGPGVSILAAWPFSFNDNTNSKSNFNVISGASMSCPHLSGVAVLLKSSHPSWSPAAIKSAIMTSVDLLNLQGKPILDQTLHAVDILLTGAGHVNPSKSNDPGLVYDIQPDDYLPNLCGKGYTDKEVRIIAHGTIKCSEESSIPEGH
ncbi:hypothetical protein TEA_014174 [Camellia sinensis var. sinensis]|uniref:Peptidase S8/S53 domain-containing protein n=1 Tax=Camellia sinensis var. sinensis TaxID=542762 RepID=A0A4S4DSI2_CAMSN|nr:hypothetical protein TEA_014174 [Camellia sinensis var. sinensis]